MKIKLILAASFALMSLFMTLGLINSASAHEHDTFKVNNTYYDFKVGSLNEPVLVDDKSGLELAVTRVAGPGVTNGEPVTGLEDTLKVELSAGDQARTLSLDPSDEAGPGAYTAAFIPTVETTYTYRIFGELEGAPVDLKFSCVQGDFSETAEDKAQVSVGTNVTRVHKVGAFGCPAGRSDYGFPEPAYTAADLNQNNLIAQNDVIAMANNINFARNLAVGGLILGIIAIGLVFTSRKPHSQEKA